MDLRDGSAFASESTVPSTRYPLSARPSAPVAPSATGFNLKSALTWSAAAALKRTVLGRALFLKRAAFSTGAPNAT
jgi:hypothetical protein